jgi:hypothetical protein
VGRIHPRGAQHATTASPDAFADAVPFAELNGVFT